MLDHSSLTRHCRRIGTASFGALVPLLLASSALAQVGGAQPLSNVSPQATPSQAQNVTVTGSLLATKNTTSQDPVTVVSAKEIENSSAVTASDVLAKLTISGTGGTYASTNNGGDGLQCYDLRNLGITRTLVLIDGKRVVNTGAFGFQCVDLSSIPVQMIERVELLPDGASSIYGADAVAGVVNFILKKNYTGTRIDVGGDISDVGDDRTGQLNAITGFDFDQGRGNFMISGNYNTQGPIQQADRPWSTPVAQTNSPVGPQTFGSGIPPTGRAFDGPNVANPLGLNAYFAPNGTNYSTFTDADRYNFGGDQYLSTYLQTENVTPRFHYDINDHVTAYVNAFYTHKDTEEQLAAAPAEGGVPPTTLPDVFAVPAGNPYNPFGEDVAIYKRLNQFGNREEVSAADTYQVTLGLRGDIVDNWTYDLWYLYGKSTSTLSVNGVNFQNLEQEMGFEQIADPNVADPSANGIYNPSVCKASAGCALANPFGSNGFSQQAINYARFIEHAYSAFQLRQEGATVTNNSLAQLPYGPLGLALGFEHRGEAGSYTPDPLVQSGLSLDNSQQPTGGGFNVSEVYGELRIPILANLPAAKNLSADVSGRFSDYNTFGAAYTWKAGANWTPVDDIRFRANIGTAFRQPDVDELFGGQALSYVSAYDPCAQVSSYGARAGTVAANCRAQGLGPNFTQNGNAQVPTITGGNPNLQPETSRTYTIGTVIQPHWVRNLSATVDYFHTTINRSIGTLDTQTILDSCYTSPGFSSPFCSDIAKRSGIGQLTTATAIDQNLGVVRTSSIDFNLNYLIHLGGRQSLVLQNNLTKLVGYIAQQINNGPFYNYAGGVDVQVYGVGYPRLRDNFTATYNRGPFSFSYTMRYIDGLHLQTGGVTLSPAEYGRTTVPGIFYHDIEGNYQWRQFHFVVGIDNLFDKNPPYIEDGTTNTDPSVYDIIGRLIYARASVTF